MSRERLYAKTVILTGAAGNIGSTISRLVLAEGANVVMTGRNLEKLNAFVETLSQEGFDPGRMMPVASDASDAAACRVLVEQVMDRFGAIDVLINNAGGAGPKQALEKIPFTEADRIASGDGETMLDAVRGLLGGPWNMVRATAPHMKPGASIVNVSTIFSRTDYYGRIPYVVPKSGLNALSLGLARELGAQGRGIRVNTVFPGPIESERIDNVFAAMDGLQDLPSGSTSEKFKGLMILERSGEDGTRRRYPTPLDVGSTVLWLATPESAALSGHAFEVTNGMQVPAQSRAKLVSWPDKRLVDLVGKVVLILGGRDLDETLAFADRHALHGASLVLGFRDIDVVERARMALQQRGAAPMPLLLLNPLRRENVERSMQLINDQFGRLDGVVVLPSRRSFGHGLAGASDDEVERFMRDELVAPVALASAVSNLLRGWSDLEEAPAITFVTNADDGAGNLLSEISRAGVEELIRVWRYEEEQQVDKDKKRWSCLPNQIVRFSGGDPETNLTFSAAWAATLTNRVRKMDEINLLVPEHIERATGKSAMPMSIQRVLPGLHSGKTAVITGGSVGIGFELGRWLAIAGARVLLAARNPERLEAARTSIVEELRAVGYPEPDGRVFILPNVDVGDEASLQGLFEHALEKLEKVDILINNAGIAGAEEMVVDMEVADWNRTMEANLISNYSLIRKFAPHMKANGSGNVLNVSSYFGGEKYLAVAYPNRSDYSVSKAGQRALSEIMSRHLGPEIQINALAPGPVDGQRLRGTASSPGLFARRGRLILENKRLNMLHQSVLESVAEGASAGGLLSQFGVNAVAELTDPPEPVRRAVERIRAGKGASSEWLMSPAIAPKLVNRLVNGGVITREEGSRFVDELRVTPEPFFDAADVDKEAAKIESGIINRLHLKTMPTDEQVAISTVFSLADEIVSGETFHPSGGLTFERSVTEGELMVKPGKEDLEKLEGKSVVLIGEEMKEELLGLVSAFGAQQVAHIEVLTETNDTAEELQKRATVPQGTEVVCRAIGDSLEVALEESRARLGRVDVVVSQPFARLPLNALAADSVMGWERVLSRDQFASVIADQLTHHFRVCRLAAVWERCQIVLVTPDTSRASTREEFALALFVKNSLHAFTVTLGVEGERLPTYPAVNQVQLTRRARTEEPGNDQEVQEEMDRFVAAVLQCSLTAPSPRDSRYLARIYRGNAVTV